MTLLPFASTWSVTLFPQILGIIIWSLAQLLDIGSKAMIEGISEVEPQIELKKDNKTCK